MDAQPTFDLVGLIVAGGLTTYPLVVGSILAIAVAIDRLLAFRGTERAVAREGARLVGVLATGRATDEACDASGAGGASAIVLPALARAVRRGTPADEFDRLVEARIFEALEGLRSRLWVLATIGSIAPFVGLFGTVVGILKSFHFIAQAGTGGFAVVASGISEALVATALGLAVAIVAVAFYNYFEARLERIEAALRIQAGRLAGSAPTAWAA